MMWGQNVLLFATAINKRKSDMQYATKTLNQNTIMAIAGTLAFCATGLAGEIAPVGFSTSNGLHASALDVLGGRGADLCGSETLTQSTNTATISPNSVWCGDANTNDETSLARGFVAPFDLTLKCVDFGISENTGGDAIVHVRVLVGSPTSAYGDLTLVSEADVLIAGGTVLSIESVDIPDVLIPMGAQFIVELNTPSRFVDIGGDGGLLSFGTNTLGQSSPTYLRGPECGIEDFTDAASFGFGDRHLVMSLGIESGIVPAIEGGFPMSPIGDAVLSTMGGELFAAGDAGGPAFGVSVGYGTQTGGAGGTFRVLSDQGTSGANVSMSFVGETQTNALSFSDYQGDPSQAVLDLAFEDPGFSSFDVRVFNDGELVGVLPNQSSGTVLFGEPPAAGAVIWDWVSGLFGLEVEISCDVEIEYVNGELSIKVTCSGSIGTSTFASTAGGDEFVGNEFQIVPLGDGMTGESPLNLEFAVSGVDALALDVGENSPTVVIGDAPSAPIYNSNNELAFAQAGVSFASGGSATGMVAGDTDGDGLADLAVSGTGLVSVEMQLGGVDSATIEIDMDTTILPCLSICPWWDNGGSVLVPGGKLNFDPWPNPFGDDLFGVLPDFDAVGFDNYSIQYWNDGQLVGEDSTSGIAGGTSQLPTMLGVVNDDQELGFSVEYPEMTEFTTADGQSIIMDEIRVLVDDQSSGQSLIVINIESEGLDGLIFSNPTTVFSSVLGCPADITGDGMLNFFDVSAFLQAFGNQDPVADFTGDGEWNFFDVSAFIQAFGEGCP